MLSHSPRFLISKSCNIEEKERVCIYVSGCLSLFGVGVGIAILTYLQEFSSTKSLLYPWPKK